MSEIPYLVRMQQRPIPKTRPEITLNRIEEDGKLIPIPIYDKREQNKDNNREGLVKRCEEVIGIISEMKRSEELPYTQEYEPPPPPREEREIFEELPREQRRASASDIFERDRELRGEDTEDINEVEDREIRGEDKQTQREGEEEEDLSDVEEAAEKDAATTQKTAKPAAVKRTLVSQRYSTDPQLKRILPTDMYNRLPKKPARILDLKVSSYYMSNRKLYTQNLKDLFQSFRKELFSDKTKVSCDAPSGTSPSKMELLIHQRIVREYLNIFTPYRGLLLYHGLGSGKTCTSIAIAEAAKTSKRIFVMTPASLKMNFFSELKKCGDEFYKKNQFWEFVSIEGNPEQARNLSQALSIPEQYIRRNKGAWLMDVRRKEPNYATLSASEQHSLDDQLDTMIRAKYVDVNYNGFTKGNFAKFVQDYANPGSGNPFDHSVVLVDEAHNLVSRIVNGMSKPGSISAKIYNYLQSAQDVRIVFMSGTPVINYPNELGVLFNMLRGHIKTWKFTIKADARLTAEKVLNAFRREQFLAYDYVDYSNEILSITRNPYGFVNKSSADKRMRGGGAKKDAGYSDFHTEVVFSKEDAKTPTNGKENRRDEEEPSEDSKSKQKQREDKTQTQTKTKKHISNKRKGKQTKKKYVLHKGALVIPPEEEVDLPDSVKDQISFELHQLRNEVGEDRYHSGGAPIVDREYNGVVRDDQGNLTDFAFEAEIKRIFRENDIQISDRVEVVINKCLPDDYDEFIQKFVNLDSGTLLRPDVLTKRILGLTSYFRSAQESLLPQFTLSNPDEQYAMLPQFDKKGHPLNLQYHIQTVEMSDHQFNDYSAERASEYEKEMKQRVPKKKDDVMKATGTYRTFTRAKCNFSFPDEIERPMPPPKAFSDKNVNDAELIDDMDDDNEHDVEDREKLDQNHLMREYARRIQDALKQLKDRATEFFTPDALIKYSPKFAKILENIQNPDNIGLHLIYSAFRTLEGVGILKIILETNGFAEFKLKKDGDTWLIDQSLDPEFAIKPRFVLYTGTETAEEKEIIRNIYNSNWTAIPPNIADELRKLNENNHMGEIIRIMMITASGAEGINLENTRFVHIVEPYWHMVRIEQVVGRARRICSHKNLPEELRSIQVFLYLSKFSAKQKKENVGIMTKDFSRMNSAYSITTDEYLYEISYAKDTLIKKLLQTVKESSIDCDVYDNSKESLVCHTYGHTTSNEFGTTPNYDEDLTAVQGTDVRKATVTLKRVSIDGTKYILNPITNDLYDYNLYRKNKEVVVGNWEHMREENPRLRLEFFGK